MKKALIIILAVFGCAVLRAQDVPDGYVWADSLVFTPINEMDTTLAGKSIYSVLPDNVQIDQSGAVRSLMIRKSEGKVINGYRIRIFFDNSRTARGDSESALYRFKSLNPGVSAYRTFSSPYFKVTVGDFRTKSEALALLQSIKPYFPGAFIVRERLKYPALGNTPSFKVDTLKFLRSANR
ncbi:MAG: hypothetical protein K6G39_03670 [Bacteroidales bacterium]|nr:hypothetical protein [Bacteroidales bacterium]